MQALVGDVITLPGRHVGEKVRKGRIVEARGSDGAPPYLVRWDDGHEGLCFPPAEARVQHAEH